MEYLDTRGASPLLTAVVSEAYVAEYGLEADQQSCLNFLLFIHADKRSKFTPFGVFSDERYHVVEGNQSIAEGLKNKLEAPIDYGMTLVKAKKTSSGQIALTFSSGSTSVTVAHDAVVLALPFSVLRYVELDASLALPAWKRDAITDLGYGTNAKTMIGFTARPWLALGGNGAAYSDLPNVQTVWETNPTNATSTRAVLTDYASGQRGASLNPNQTSQQAEAFVADLDLVMPGVAAAVRRNAQNKIVAHLEHWPSSPLSRGSYTCYTLGQFTSIAGNEGKSVGNLYFAGEHTNSFYEWQGFMEGACLSGIAAAEAILADL